MKGGMALNSVDLKTIFDKTAQKQATLRNNLGKRNGFGPLFGHFF